MIFMSNITVLYYEFIMVIIPDSAQKNKVFSAQIRTDLGVTKPL